MAQLDHDGSASGDGVIENITSSGNSVLVNSTEEMTEQLIQDDTSTAENSTASEKLTTEDTSSRAQWDNKFQFILTLIGFAVGLGNVWRFSYYVKRNGGGAFLIPYWIMLFVLGIPSFYLELTLGQKMRRGPYQSWFKIFPPLAGVGIASVITVTYISLYYNVIISWVLFYFVNSFRDPLPWEKCCGYKVDHMNRANVSYNLMMGGNCSDVPTIEAIEACTQDFTKYYWYNHVIRVSDDIGDAGEFNWQLLICLFCAWLITYLCLFRGIKSSGKVAYVTAVFPYIVLTILFFRGVTLDGAGDGMEFLFKPDWSKLYLPQVWLEAATQIFFSLGISTGAIIALSSYSSSTNTALRDTTFVCIVNSATSLFSSITIFCILGFKSHETGVSINDVANGPGLAFIAFTEAITLLPGSPFWAVLFFLMLMTLGVDSQFTSLEGMLTVLFDNKYLAKIRKEIVVAVVCVLMFIVSIPFVLGNGFYLFQLFDQFAGTIPLLLIAICEYIGVAWVYGTRKFLADIVKPGRNGVMFFWWLWWTFVAPFLMIVVFLGSLVTNFIEPLEYVRYSNYEENDDKPYPGWARFVGSLLIISATLPIPLVFIIRLIWKKGERHDTAQWFINFPKRCHAAWNDFKDLCSIMKIRIVGNRVRVSFRKYTNYRSWSPDQPPYVDIHGQDSLTSTHTL